HLVDLAVHDGLGTWQDPRWHCFLVRHDLVTCLPDMLLGVLAVEDAKQRLVAEDLVAVLDEVSATVGDTDPRDFRVSSKCKFRKQPKIVGKFRWALPAQEGPTTCRLRQAGAGRGPTEHLGLRQPL